MRAGLACAVGGRPARSRGADSSLLLLRRADEHRSPPPSRAAPGRASCRCCRGWSATRRAIAAAAMALVVAAAGAATPSANRGSSSTTCRPERASLAFAVPAPLAGTCRGRTPGARPLPASAVAAGHAGESLDDVAAGSPSIGRPAGSTTTMIEAAAEEGEAALLAALLARPPASPPNRLGLSDRGRTTVWLAGAHGRRFSADRRAVDRRVWRFVGRIGGRRKSAASTGSATTRWRRRARWWQLPPRLSAAGRRAGRRPWLAPPTVRRRLLAGSTPSAGWSRPTRCCRSAARGRLGGRAKLALAAARRRRPAGPQARHLGFAAGACVAARDHDVEMWVHAAPDGEDVLLTIERWKKRRPAGPGSKSRRATTS